MYIYVVIGLQKIHAFSMKLSTNTVFIVGFEQTVNERILAKVILGWIVIFTRLKQWKHVGVQSYKHGIE